jgi:hypothetical protein
MDFQTRVLSLAPAHISVRRAIGSLRTHRFPLPAAVLCAVLWVNCGSARASVTACAGQTMATLQIASGNTPPNGCGQVDLGFNNFTNPNSSGSLTPPGASGITLSSTGGSISGSTINPIDLTFSSSGWSVASLNPSGDFMQSAFDNEASVLAGQSPPPQSGNHWGITGLGLTLSYSTSGSPVGDVQVEEQFCLGSTSFNCSTTSSNYGYLEETVDLFGTTSIGYVVCVPGSGGCAYTSPSSASITFANPGYTSIGIQDTVQVFNESGTAGNSLTLNTFTEAFDQTDESPEPSTLTLAGLGLVALGFASRSRVLRSTRR